MGDGDILEGNVEFRSSEGEVGADTVRDGFSLGDELGGVELGDDGLEDFVTDGGEDSLIVIGTEVLSTCQRSDQNHLFSKLSAIHTW